MPNSDGSALKLDSRDQKRDNILRAALEVFARDGFAKAKIDDIAALAGIGKGTVYLYASSKLELFKSVVLAGIEPVAAEFDEFVSNTELGPTELLEQLVRRLYREMNNPDREKFLRLLLSDRGDVEEVKDFYREHVVSRGEYFITIALERGVKQGEFNDIDVSLVSKLIMGPIISRLLHKVIFGLNTENTDVYFQSHMDLLLAGLKRPT